MKEDTPVADTIKQVFKHTITGVFTLRSHNIVYAYIYVHKSAPIYVCFGHSFISSDGEYRMKFMPADMFTNAYYTGVLSTFEPDESLLDVEASYISFDEKPPLFHVDKSRLPLQLITTAGVNYTIITQSTRNVSMFHIDKTYKDFLSRDMYKHFTKKINEYTSIRDIHESLHKSSIVSIIKHEGIGIPIGQKIVPLYRKDMYNSSTSSWTELYCYLLSNELLSIGDIITYAPWLIDWYIIPMEQKMFSSRSILAKIVRSERAEKSLLSLVNVKHDMEKYATIMAAIDNPIDLAEARLILSDHAILYIIEHVGYTFCNILTEDTPSFTEWVKTRINIEEYLEYYVFNLLYTLFNFHINGVIHGDLHLNNCTITATVKSTIANMTLYNSSVYKYEIGEKYARYIEHHPRNFSCLIDFSRALLLPDNAELKSLLKDTVINAFKVVLGETSEQKLALIEASCLIAPQQVWLLFTAYDVYLFTSQLIELKRCKTIMTILKDVNNMAYDFLQEIINIPTSSAHSKQPDLKDITSYPLYKILTSVWKSHTKPINDVSRDKIHTFKCTQIKPIKFESILDSKIEIKSKQSNTPIENKFKIISI